MDDAIEEKRQRLITAIPKLKKDINGYLSLMLPDDKHKHKYLEWTFFDIFLTIFIPLFPIAIYVLAWMDVCLAYAQVLQGVTLGLFIFSWLIAYIHVIVYNNISLFCSDEAKKLHYIHTTLLFHSMGGTLAWMVYFTYAPYFGYYIPAVFMSFIVVLEYFASIAMRHMFRYCIYGGFTRQEVNRRVCGACLCPETDDWVYDDFFTIFSVLFTISWVGFCICVVALSEPLLDPANRAPYLNACLPLLTQPPS